MADNEKAVDAKAGAAEGPRAPQVRWDDSNMRSSYANVVNATSSREEVTIFFGTNQTWNPSDKEVTIQLTDRIILSPFAAKRLMLLLRNVLGEYESRYGKLDVEGQPRPATA